MDSFLSRGGARELTLCGHGTKNPVCRNLLFQYKSIRRVSRVLEGMNIGNFTLMQLSGSLRTGQGWRYAVSGSYYPAHLKGSVWRPIIGEASRGTGRGLDWGYVTLIQLSESQRTGQIFTLLEQFPQCCYGEFSVTSNWLGFGLFTTDTQCHNFTYRYTYINTQWFS